MLPIATDVLELEITPNRPDCLSVYGVAREVHAATETPLAPAPWAEDPPSARPTTIPGFAVEVQAPDLCPRFTARLFEDVRIGPSPPWLKARLMAAGQRPINNVVDITNYVMLLTGQPMHAFDADLVAGGRLVVRRARDGGDDDHARRRRAAARRRTLCVIDGRGRADVDRRRSWAALARRCATTTTRVVMEAATWDGPNVQRTSTRLGLRTEASGRFEKGLAPEQGLEGQAVAARLMVELCGARPVGGTIDVGGPGPAPLELRLRDAYTERLLGVAVPRADAARILAGLGFGVGEAADGLAVTVPHWRRTDVTREADLVEEVARLWGLERIPSTLPARRGAVGRLAPAQRLRRRAEDALVGAGLSEAVGWSFGAPGLPARLGLAGDDPRAHPIPLENPMSEDQSVMRTTLLGSLLDALHRNRTRGFDDVRLFEVGAIYLGVRPLESAPLKGSDPLSGGDSDVNPWYPVRDPALPDERLHVCALLTGRMRPPSWRDPEPPAADFFAAKGVLEALMRALRVPFRVEPASDEPFLHPRRGAAVLVGDERAGWLGELHPSVAAGWDLEGVAGFELDTAVVAAAATLTPRYEDLTSFPSVRQDLAVTLPEAVPAARVLAVIRAAGGPLLAGAEVFDVYRGPQVGEGRASLAVRLEFRAPDRTLTDAEADERRRRDRRRAGRPARGRAAWLASRSSAPPATPGRSPPRSCTDTRSSTCGM